MDKLLRNIDEKLWREVKAQAALEGMSMKDWVQRVLAEKLRGKQEGNQQLARTSKGASRAGRCALGLVKALVKADDEWHPTAYFAAAAGKYVRPEVAWRIAQRKDRPPRDRENVEAGRHIYVRQVLYRWWKSGRLERKMEGGEAMWRLANTEWTEAYLREASEKKAAYQVSLKEASKRGIKDESSNLLSGKHG